MKLTQACTAASSVCARSMDAAMLPVVCAVPMFCTHATRAPASSAECTADSPDSPAPTTTTSNSWVAAKSVMGSGACRKLGPACVWAAAACAEDACCGAHPASALAPSAPNAATPPSLSASRRVTFVKSPMVSPSGWTAPVSAPLSTLGTMPVRAVGRIDRWGRRGLKL